MYLSIGNDMAVRDTSIIGIFDLDNTPNVLWNFSIRQKKRA